MSKKKRFGVSEQLSRSFSETIAVVENNDGRYRTAVVPMSRIELDPDNPRKLAFNLDDARHGIKKDDPEYKIKQQEHESLMELAHTIDKSGIINPIVVYKHSDHYRVVAGERRCLASILAGKSEIEARIFKERPDGFSLKLLQWVENTARQDLSLQERLDNVLAIVEAYKKTNTKVALTATLLSNLTGLSLPQATCYMSLINAPKDVTDLVAEGKLQNLDKAAILAKIDSATIRQEASEACLKGINISELRKLIKNKKELTKTSRTQDKKAKAGRKSSSVNLGVSKNPAVAKAIVDAVLKQEKYQNYALHFKTIDWRDIDSATLAMKKLIKILETHE